MADFHSLPITSQQQDLQDTTSPALFEQKILLVCIINYKRLNITFEILFNLFSSYGEVKKILFFEKTLTWKAFVEMGTHSQAVTAKNALNNIQLFNDGSKLNIYLSNLKELVLPKNMMNGKDFSKTQESSTHSLTEIPEKEKIHNEFKAFSLQEIKLMDESPSNNFNLKRTGYDTNKCFLSPLECKSLEAIQENEEHFFPDNFLKRQNSIDQMIISSNSSPPNVSKMFNLGEPPGLSKSINKQKQNELKSAELSKKSSVSTASASPFLNNAPTINNNINANNSMTTIKQPSIPLMASSNSFMNINLGSNCSTPLNDKMTPTNFNVFAGEASKVLFIKGLEDPKIKVQVIYNLFSNFGNISKIIYMRNKNGALIEFQSVEYATIAKDFLNNLNFFSNYLRISYSNYQEIVLKNVNFGGDLKEDILICEENLMRFKKNKNILINPPSNVIHLSNLPKEACFEEKIRRFLEGLGNIEKIKFLIQENQKNMCLVKFSKLEESLLAISMKHNCELEGRDVKISFTKTKI